MRHAKKFNHLGRKTAHRKAMLANMGCSIIEHKRIFTTVAKAKAVRMFLEPIITKAKTNTTHNRRNAFSSLRNKFAVTELFDVIAAKVGDRPGGYLRIIKTGFRSGDSADMAMIELVDYNEVYTQAKEGAKAKKKRSRRGSSKKKAEETVVEENVEDVADATESTETPETDSEATDAPEESKK